MKTDEERREERRRYEHDVYYEVWRRGGNPDSIDPDRVADQYYTGRDYHDAASSVIREQEQASQRRREQDAAIEDEYHDALGAN